MAFTSEPSVDELKSGYLAFQARERRDAMYETATYLVGHFWHDPSRLANSLGVLLLTWNNAFYRYGVFDFDELEACIVRNQGPLQSYRQRSILSYGSSDDNDIALLFSEFLDSLQIADGNSTGRKSPVGVAKALHLLAPDFFPLWDDKIARAYGYYYDKEPAVKYLGFIYRMQGLVKVLQPHIDTNPMGKTLLKLIDEYNYSRYTKQWT